MSDLFWLGFLLVLLEKGKLDPSVCSSEPQALTKAAVKHLVLERGEAGTSQAMESLSNANKP